MKFVKNLPKERMFSFMRKKNPTPSELSTLLLLNSTAIFGAFAGEQHLIKVGR